ncbi:unnamed protein product [Gongylonema pulchrum]|uniref:DH domain-containing protein n=1 Tax=Gongylonema pulchrum TaxID=637853 RepID=A0A183EDE5_9BILA|nr:unnamed protein product [Gongylonema pulchrum]
MERQLMKVINYSSLLRDIAYNSTEKQQQVLFVEKDVSSDVCLDKASTTVIVLRDLIAVAREPPVLSAEALDDDMSDPLKTMRMLLVSSRRALVI